VLSPRTQTLTCLLLAALLAPSSAPGFELADTVGDGSGEPLAWPAGEPIPFRFHYRGSDDLSEMVLESLIRSSYATWARDQGSSVTLEEGRIFVGAAAHHPGPTEVDGQSAIFFIEALWPHGPEVIALTSVSFAADGEILDADIAFNGADHTFTTVDTGGEKDFVSIATHEIGHFLGLAHSLAPDATMFAEYENGDTYLRDLSADDEAGIAANYPCGSPPCAGTVGWVDGKACSSGSGAASVFALALGFGALGVRRRRVGGALVAAGLTVAAISLPGAAESTLVEELAVEVLADGADRVLRGSVVDVRAAFVQGMVVTYATVSVTEDWVGSGAGEVELVLPGGVLDTPVAVVGADGVKLPKELAGTLVFGAPRVAVGDDVVVFVDTDELQDVSTVRGLAQGLFVVQRDGTVGRDVSGLAFARTAGHAPLPVVAPDTLRELADRIAR